MLVGVISDTHRMKGYIDIAKKYLKSCHIILHLGDNIDDVEELGKGYEGEIYAVAGNCDFSKEYERETTIDIEGIKIFLTHGDGYGVKYGLENIFFRGKELNCDVILFGHTHEHLLIEEEGILIMNPGSVSLPRSTGRHIGFIEIEDNKIKDAYLKEIEEE